MFKREETIVKNIIDFLTRITKKQELFCLYYIRTHNAALAYSKAYNCSDATGRIRACELLKRSNIQYYISTLVKYNMDSKTISVIQLFIDIAFSNITDVCEFGTEQSTLMYNGKPIKALATTGEQKEITLMSQYFRLKKNFEYFTTGVKTIKFNKDGSLRQVTMDEKAKFKALDFLYEHLELVNRAFMFETYIDKLIQNNLEELSKQDINFNEYRESIYKHLVA